MTRLQPELLDIAGDSSTVRCSNGSHQFSATTGDRGKLCDASSRHIPLSLLVKALTVPGIWSIVDGINLETGLMDTTVAFILAWVIGADPNHIDAISLGM